MFGFLPAVLLIEHSSFKADHKKRMKIDAHYRRGEWRRM